MQRGHTEGKLPRISYLLAPTSWTAGRPREKRGADNGIQRNVTRRRAFLYRKQNRFLILRAPLMLTGGHKKSARCQVNATGTLLEDGRGELFWGPTDVPLATIRLKKNRFTRDTQPAGSG